MKIAPLIRSRTRYTEFNDREKFLVRPADLDLQWAMNKISPAMINVDTLEGVRRVVASNGELCIAGVVCGLQYFVREYLSSDEAENFRDKEGRAVKIFLGYVFKGEGVPDVSDSKLWKMFKDNLAPLWERKTIDPVIVDSYESCGVKNISTKSSDQKIYPSGKKTDVELFEQCLAARKDFCSNVDDVKIFENGEYEIITASPSVINRLQKKKSIPARDHTKTKTGHESSAKNSYEPYAELEAFKNKLDARGTRCGGSGRDGDSVFFDKLVEELIKQILYKYFQISLSFKEKNE